MSPPFDSDQMLVMPPAPHAADEPLITQATILEDVFEPATAAPTAPQEKTLTLFSQETVPTPPVASPPKFGPAAREWGRRSFPPQRSVAAEKLPPPAEQTPAPAAPERPAAAQGRQAKPAATQEKTPVSQEIAPKAGRAPQAAKGRDRYSFGVQMMRVSPAWLVVGGLAFVSLIVLCTWLVKPARQEEQFAARVPARNQATNQRPADASKPPTAATNKQATAARPDAQKTATEQKPAEPKPAAESKPAELKAAESKPVVPAAAADLKEDGKFTVQVGSFPDEAQARERVNRLKAAGFDGRVVAAQIPNRGTWYRVQAGRFGDRDAAGRYGSAIRSKGVADGAMVTEVQ